jgi:hypothetical protein
VALVVRLSSLPTRGCSGGQVRLALGRFVHPVDAGVFRTRRRRRPAALGPLRRRGGVPALEPSASV